jgi:hypothetical protein
MLSWVLQTLASSTLVILGCNTIDSGRGKFLSHHLERKITELRHAYEEKIGVPSGMRLEFGGKISGNMRLSFQAARSIG